MTRLKRERADKVCAGFGRKAGVFMPDTLHPFVQTHPFWSLWMTSPIGPAAKRQLAEAAARRPRCGVVVPTFRVATRALVRFGRGVSVTRVTFTPTARSTALTVS
jgi:hypothetical protein